MAGPPMVVTGLAPGAERLVMLAPLTVTLTGDATGSGTTAIPVTLDTVNSSPGSFTNANITVNAKGLVTAAANGSGGGSGITQLTGDVTAGPGSGSQAATLATVNSNVGTFQGLTVNGKGLVTAAVNESYLTANQTVTLTGDVSGSGTTAITVTLDTVMASPGTYNNVTVNGKGLVTAGSNAAYLTGNQTITLTGYTTGSGATSIATTTSAVQGTTAGGNATAGDVGEYASAIVLIASEVNINVAATVVTLSLTAGDWDVWGELWVDTSTGSAVVNSRTTGAISLNAATVGNVPADTQARTQVDNVPLVPTISSFILPIGPVRINLTSTSDVFLSGACGVSAGTPFGYGILKARRVR